MKEMIASFLILTQAVIFKCILLVSIIKKPKEESVEVLFIE